MLATNAVHGLGLADVTVQTHSSKKLARSTNLGLSKHPSTLASCAQSLLLYSPDTN